MRQTLLYRSRESGNAMKEALGLGHLAWAAPLEQSPSGFQEVAAHHDGVDLDELELMPEKPFQAGVEVDQSGGAPGRALEARSTRSSQRQGAVSGRGRAVACTSGAGAGRSGAAEVQQPHRATSRSAVVTASPAGTRAVRPASAGAEVRLSRARFDSVPVASAFSTGGSSRFAQDYAKGMIPCHIDHGTCSHRISWSVTPAELRARRDELLVLSVQGLCETKHPLSTLSRLAATELARLADCAPVADKALRAVMEGLRAVLTAAAPVPVPQGTGGGAGGGRGCGGSFEAALSVVSLLAKAEGPRLAPHVQLILPPLAKHARSKAHQGGVKDVVRDLAAHGGPSVVQVLRRRGIVVEATA